MYQTLQTGDKQPGGKPGGRSEVLAIAFTYNMWVFKKEPVNHCPEIARGSNWGNCGLRFGSL